MTSCQRVSRMMQRQDHDRIPRHESFWLDTIERWKTEGVNALFVLSDTAVSKQFITKIKDKFPHILLVVESDEYDRSFLSFQPHVALVTNVEADHLDIYKDLEEIAETFRAFLALVPPFLR